MKRNFIIASIVVVLISAGLLYIVISHLWKDENMSKENETTIRETVTLVGAGSSFIYPQLDYWAKELSKTHPWIRIEYSPTGSGAGQRMLIDKVVDFAGSDPPLSPERLEQARGDPRGVIQMPIVVGGVVVIYNIPGLDGRLRLNGEVLALIYKGDIEYWDDPRILALNPDLRLPHEKIIVVHRSDASGTTNIFTLYLYKSSGGIWPKELVGLSVNWPVAATGRAIGGKGNPGVAEVVSKTPYSIGYVEYSHAVLAGLKWALLMNREGEFVDANPETFTAALIEVLPHFPLRPDGDFNRAWESTIYAPGKNAYPMVSFAFLIFYQVYPDANKAEAVRTLIQWLNTEGYKYMAQGYVAVPPEVREYNLKAIDLIRVG